MCSAYGWASFIACPLESLFTEINLLTESVPISILLLAVIIKCLLLPLYIKSKKESQKLARLAPKLKELRIKYQKEPQRMLLAQQQIYQKENVSPIKGACLQLLSIPPIYGAYLVFNESSILNVTESFLWLQSLSLPDPFYLLPFLLGTVLISIQLLFPTIPLERSQSIIVIIMAAASTLFMSQIASGLALFYCGMAMCQLLFDCLWKLVSQIL